MFMFHLSSLVIVIDWIIPPFVDIAHINQQRHQWYQMYANGHTYRPYICVKAEWMIGGVAGATVTNIYKRYSHVLEGISHGSNRPG